MLRRFALPVGFLVLGVFAQPPVLHAQTSDCSLPAYGDYCLSEWDAHLQYIEGTITGWSSGPGVVTYPDAKFSLLGGNGERYVRLTGHCISNYSVLEYTVTLPEGRVPARIEAYKQSAAAGAVNRDVGIRSRPVPNTGEWTNHAITTGAYQVNQQATWTNNGTLQAGHQLSIFASNFCNAADAYVQLAVTLVYAEDDRVIQYVRPLIPDNSTPIFEPPSEMVPETAIAQLTKKRDDQVYAADTGTITRIAPATVGTCNALIGNPASSIASLRCWLTMPAETAGNTIDVGLRSTIAAQYYLVDLVNEDGVLFRYILSDFSVTEGQTIQAGCPIGRPIPVEADPLVHPVIDSVVAFFAALFGSPIPEPTAAILRTYYEDEPVDLFDLFTIDPSPNSCITTSQEGYEHCLGDAQLRDREQWTSANASWSRDGGVTLWASGYIEAQFNLDQDRAPQMDFGARALGTSSRLTAQLGETTESFMIPASVELTRNTVITTGPDGTFYTVRINNGPGSHKFIQYICVWMTEDGEGNPVDPEGPPGTPGGPETCVFKNYTFNDGSEHWTISNPETAEADNGEIRLPHEQTISQAVSVDAGTYPITVWAGLWHYPSYTGSETNTDQVTIEYRIGSGDWVSIGAQTYGEYVIRNNLVRYQTSLVLESDVSDTIYIRPSLADIPTGVRGVAIKSVCIGDTGEGGGGGGGVGGADGCSIMAEPSGSDVGQWLRWHWSRLGTFLECSLMPFLESLYTSLLDFFDTVLWTIRYWVVLIQETYAWIAEQLLPWLGGHFANMAGANTYYIGEQAAECAPFDIFCHLSRMFDVGGGIIQSIIDLLDNLITSIFGPLVGTLLYMLTAVFDVFLNLLNAIIAAALLVLGAIANAIQMALAGMAAIVDAWIAGAAAPIVPDFLPNCETNPEHGVCMAYWIMDNTVFTGWGALWIPTMAGGAALLLVMRIIRSVIAAIKSASEAS